MGEACSKPQFDGDESTMTENGITRVSRKQMSRYDRKTLFGEEDLPEHITLTTISSF